MKRYLPYLKLFKPVRWQLAGGILAGLLFAAATGAGIPVATETIFPLIFPEDGTSTTEVSNWLTDLTERWLGDTDRNTIVFVACMWLPGMFLVRAVCGFLNSYLMAYCSYRVLEKIRNDVFEKLQSLPISFFHRYQSGDILARLIGDAQLLRTAVTRIARDIIKQPIVLLSAFSYLIYQAATHKGTFILLISIATIPLCIMPLRIIAKKLGKKARSLQNTSGDLSGQIAETLNAPMEIRAYNLQGEVIARFKETVNRIIGYSMKVVKYRYLVSPSVEFIAVLGLTIALVIGSQQEDVMSLTRFMAVGMALYLSYEPVKKLGEIHSVMKQGEAAIERLEEILHAPDKIEEPENPQVPEKFFGEVDFEDVEFGYGKEVVVKKLNMTIKQGECVALIGPSGGGKSSIFNLIPRFYDVNSGAVKVSGLDVRDWGTNTLRDHIAVVSQSPVLFSGTIRENILLGRPGASEEEVITAAKRAHAHEFILAQEKGYETDIAEMGTSLSGGQSQRVAIARAFLKDAPILLLDEATSALDNESESKIQEELRELIKDRTTLLIAHRLSTTKIADRVIELDQGEIISERAEA